MFRRFTYRQVAFFGALLVAFSIYLTSISNSFVTYIITFSILYGNYTMHTKQMWWIIYDTITWRLLFCFYFFRFKSGAGSGINSSGKWFLAVFSCYSHQIERHFNCCHAFHQQIPWRSTHISRRSAELQRDCHGRWPEWDQFWCHSWLPSFCRCTMFRAAF